MTSISSLARLDYGLETPSGHVIKSVECRVGLESVADDPYRFALCVSAPLPQGLEQASTVDVRVQGRRLQGTVLRVEHLDDARLKLEVEPD
ncbi:hypothetical protein KVG96_15000 [Pseudomonas sp. COR58]|uniref:Uncharacterized protein n=1 Tax=Pseudomonas ekonensis TaxID=2842353 RepID=A0ABS6PFL0_9PSED|nr:hypothetical protein [Pseudomonas ekonensis]MBV4459260.1 hypothetical protein [Pseudomonas ekonensis]